MEFIVRKREKNPVADSLALSIRPLAWKHNLRFWPGGSRRHDGQFHVHATEMHTFVGRSSFY